MYFSSYFCMHVLINNVQWRLLLTDNTEDLKRTDGSITLGVTDLNMMTIYLWKGLKGSMLRRVLIHELSHAFIFSYEYYLTVEEEEFLCSFIDTYADSILSEADELIRKGFIEMKNFS